MTTSVVHLSAEDSVHCSTPPEDRGPSGGARRGVAHPDCTGLRLVPVGADPLADVAEDGSLHVFDDAAEFLLSVQDCGAHLQASRWLVAELRVTHVRDVGDLSGALVGEPLHVVSSVPLFQWLVRRGHARYEERAKEERRRELMRSLGPR